MKHNNTQPLYIFNRENPPEIWTTKWSKEGTWFHSFGRRRTEPHSKLPNERSEVKGKCYRNKILSDSTNFLQICRPLIVRWWQKPFGMPTENKMKIIPYETGLGQYVIQLAFRYAYASTSIETSMAYGKHLWNCWKNINNYVIWRVIFLYQLKRLVYTNPQK